MKLSTLKVKEMTENNLKVIKAGARRKDDSMTSTDEARATSTAETETESVGNSPR